MRTTATEVLWETIPIDEAPSEPFPDPAELLDAIGHPMKRSQARRHARAFIEKWGPPTTSNPAEGLYPFCAFGLNRLGLAEWLGLYAKLLMAANAVMGNALGQSVSELVLREFVPYAVARTAGVPEGQRQKIGNILPLMFQIGAFRHGAFGIQMSSTAEWEPFLGIIPDPRAPLFSVFSIALLDLQRRKSGARSCENFERCGGVIMDRAKVGRPARFCERCSPRGSTNSTERVRAFRARKRKDLLPENQ